MNPSDRQFPVSLQRRRFVQGLALGGVLTSAPTLLHGAPRSYDLTNTGYAPQLSGKTINLEISAAPVNFTGVVRMATP